MVPVDRWPFAARVPMKLPGVVGEDGVGEQDHDALIATAASIVPNGTGVDDGLQLLHGLTAYQEPIGTAPELGLRRVVGQVHSAPQLAELGAGAMETQAAGGRAEMLEQERG